MNTKKLIACDVCDTLYRSNTTFDFVRHLVSQEGKIKYIIFELISRKYSPFFYLLTLAGKFMSIDIIRTLILKFLAGKRTAYLNDQAVRFYDSILEKRRNESVFALLENQKKNGEILLVSSSIDPIINEIAQRNGFLYKSSALEYQNGLATGRLKEDMTGRKQFYLREFFAQNEFKELVAITDNQSDFEMVKMANEKYVVIRSQKDKKFWGELNPIFVSV